MFFALLFLSALASTTLLSALFSNRQADIISITTAFLIVSAVAALTFTYAQTVAADTETHHRLVISGEILLFGSLGLLVSAILRQGVVQGGFDPISSKYPAEKNQLLSIISSLSSILFTIAIIA